jgi:hypothetical protein
MSLVHCSEGKFFLKEFGFAEYINDDNKVLSFESCVIPPYLCSCPIFNLQTQLATNATILSAYYNEAKRSQTRR